MARAEPFGQEGVRKSRACIPCHERKVGCSASQTGLPCARCVKSGRTHQCELIKSPNRSGGRPRKRKRISSDDRRDLHERISSGTGQPSQIPHPVDNSQVFDFPLDRINPVPILPSTGRGAPPIVEDRSTGSALGDFGAETVSEEDSQLETCRKIAHWDDDQSSLTRIGLPTQGREVLEYNDGVNSTTILGELFGHENPRKLVRILLHESIPTEQTQTEHLENAKLEFLRSVGAFTLPPTSICEKLLQLYFERVYPYIPILDRCTFMREFSSGRHSVFLLQCILTSVAPYMSSQLLLETGHADLFSAQRSFFSKAQLLYDLGAEKSKLVLLQGSLVLTSTYFSFGLDKDCRFWLANAVRLAIQMGLHQRNAAEHLGSSTKKLFTRIFWVLYTRDVVMVMAGRTNVRTMNDRQCDVPELTIDDWEDESNIGRFSSVLSPVTTLQKLYLVQSTKLSSICAQFIETFRVSKSVPSRSVCDDLERAITQWRGALPLELYADTVADWSNENVWILVLKAMSYRLECVFYRNLRKIFGAGEDQSRRRALQKQQGAMLEFDAIIDRVMLHTLVGFCPLSITTCASIVIAMHIEIALSPSSSGPQRRISQTHIHNGLAFLRSSSEYWHSIRWTLHMFEVIVARTGLSLRGLDHFNFDLAFMNPFSQEKTQTSEDHVGTVTKNSTSCNIPDGAQAIADGNTSVWIDFPSYPGPFMADADVSYETIMRGEDPERWINELFNENVL